jgi:PPK2 family polyphosphate:nucleotide phosphotransferase
MKLNNIRYDGSRSFDIYKADTKIKDLYEDKAEYEAMMADLQVQLGSLQDMMYAHNRYGMLVILQAMDAAGKDGTIKHVLSGVNPIGLQVHSFKRPTEDELAHDFMWRNITKLPERGSMTIFNRSYYEEVLVVKVHPEIIQNHQKIPAQLTENIEELWINRYQDIANFEAYLQRNGIAVVKIFLHVSKEEQAERLIERIEDPTKNWKFDENDVKERGFWDDYMAAYRDCINATASPRAPWYVVPADDKKNMRLMVAQILIEELQKLSFEYPEVTPERQKILQGLIEKIKEQNQ